MKLKKLKKDLEWRGLLKEIVNEEDLEKIINKSGKFYIGIDPTADSIHIGHFLSLNLARILNNYKLRPVLVIGGFTGMIGDPSGKNKEREVIDRKKIKKNVKSITKQLYFLCKKLGFKKFEIFNNNKIYKKLKLVDFYHIYGKLFNINSMLSKDSVKNRIETGISYTEFSYQLFQSIDFYYLFKKKNVQLQIGGSDQWGNIIAGIELIRKMELNNNTKLNNKVVSGITINLLTDENGVKIGKTQGNPIWLDKNKTSSYEIFQFFFNQSDLMARKLIIQLTGIFKREYDILVKKASKNPEKRLVQQELAKRFITLIRSKDEYFLTKKLSYLLFNEKYKNINKKQINLLKSLPSINNENIPLIDLVVKNNLSSSKREYRELLRNNSVKINGTIINNDEFLISKNDFILNKIIFLNLGKKNRYLIWK